MTELEQLRKELNELRERVAVLERQVSMPVRDGHPVWVPKPDTSPYSPPYVVTCGVQP